MIDLVIINPVIEFALTVSAVIIAIVLGVFFLNMVIGLLNAFTIREEDKQYSSEEVAAWLRYYGYTTAADLWEEKEGD